MRLFSEAWRRSALGAFCAAAFLAACGGGGSSSAPPTGPSSGSAPSIWILQGPGLEAQAMATNPEGITFFSNPTRTVLYPVIANVPAPSSWKTIRWNKYASYAAFKLAVATQSVPPGTKIVGYDDEDWAYTPVNEQLNPIGYTIQFAKLAHAHGYRFMSMPAEDLMNGLSLNPDKYAAFVDFGMAQSVAPYVDYFHVQSQGLEDNPAGFAAYVGEIAREVHSTNPNAVVTAGISTSLQGTPASGSAIANFMDQSISVTQNIVAGYWLNIVGATTSIASTALENAP